MLHCTPSPKRRGWLGLSHLLPSPGPTFLSRISAWDMLSPPGTPAMSPRSLTWPASQIPPRCPSPGHLHEPLRLSYSCYIGSCFSPPLWLPPQPDCQLLQWRKGWLVTLMPGAQPGPWATLHTIVKCARSTEGNHHLVVAALRPVWGGPCLLQLQA